MSAPNSFPAQKILITGLVQGVGFRPHLYRLAADRGLKGEVANSLRGVELVLQGDEADVKDLVGDLKKRPPEGALIAGICISDILTKKYAEFAIVASSGGGRGIQLLAPADFGMCPECERELLDPSDHRYQHPFISCTSCGPRFSLISGLPYDRHQTSMADFPLCPRCQAEYDDPVSRRFHAEPICCPHCGPQLVFIDQRGQELDTPLVSCTEVLQAGGVVAIKGVGGFHLAADATNDEAVARLRVVKKREDKPLAIMVRNLEQAARLAQVSPDAARALTSPARPIVIMPTLPGGALSGLVAPGMAEVGMMLAYTPLHFLLFGNGPAALIMTSYNAPGEPMHISTTAAMAGLGMGCDGVLSHNRAIINRCDDSVLRSQGDEVIVIRRSRGYAPLPVQLAQSGPNVLACGAGEKVTFCLTNSKQAFLSQHLGESRSPASQDYYRQSCTKLQELLGIRPEVVAHDLHPDFFSSRYAAQLPQAHKIAVQHHHAHIASCMAEHGLAGPVIGLALDGTGLGSDGTLWGGEILRVELTGFERLGHFDELPMPGGEAAIHEPWRLGLAWLDKNGYSSSALPFLEGVGRHDQQAVLAMLRGSVNCPVTTSLGRLFDAVAALIGLRSTITFSAQAAMELETIVAPLEHGAYAYKIGDTGAGMRVLTTRGILEGILADLETGASQAVIAARFHNSVVEMLVAISQLVCREQGISQVVCSGGVLHNKVICHGLQNGLRRAGLQAYFHRQVPCNDGGLALGQAVVAAACYQRQQGGKPPEGRSHA